MKHTHTHTHSSARAFGTQRAVAGDSRGSHRCRRRRPGRARWASGGRTPSCPRRRWRRRTCSRRARPRPSLGRPGRPRRAPSCSGRPRLPSGHERPYKGSHVRYASRSSRSHRRPCARRLLLLAPAASRRPPSFAPPKLHFGAHFAFVRVILILPL